MKTRIKKIEEALESRRFLLESPEFFERTLNLAILEEADNDLQDFTNLLLMVGLDDLTLYGVKFSVEFSSVYETTSFRLNNVTGKLEIGCKAAINSIKLHNSSTLSQEEMEEWKLDKFRSMNNRMEFVYDFYNNLSMKIGKRIDFLNEKID